MLNYQRVDRSKLLGPPFVIRYVSTGFKYIEDFPCRQWINSYNSTVSKRTMHGWPHCGNNERTIPSMGEFLSQAPGPLTPWPSRLVGWGWWPTGDETRMVAICFFRFWWVMMGKLSSFMVEVGFLKGSCQQMVRKCDVRKGTVIGCDWRLSQSAAWCTEMARFPLCFQNSSVAMDLLEGSLIHSLWWHPQHCCLTIIPISRGSA